jgi:outer membrane protein TolC
LLNAIVKDFIDPALLNIEVVPTDTVQVPPPVEDMPLGNAVQEALGKRPDVLLSRLNMTAHDINVRAVRSALLPTITFNGFVSGTGLAGNTRGANAGIFSGFPTAMSTVLHGEFPEYQAQITMNIPIRNRAAQADMARALLVQQQDQARLLQLQNTVAVDVQNTQIALRQARAALEAAQQTRVLQEQALQAEQTRFQLGASTIFLVVQAQRDLSTAASSEVRARVDLAQAQADFERAMGRTLEVNRIDITDAKAANAPTVARAPSLKINGQLMGQNRSSDWTRNTSPIWPNGAR